MSTKNDKYSFIEQSFTITENQNSNFNLNQYKKCPILVPVHSYSKPNKDKYYEKGKLQSWNKSFKVSTFTTLNEDNNDLKNLWKNENTLKTINKSSLSLHIAAYENLVASDLFSKNENIDGLKKEKFGSIKISKQSFTDRLMNPFEFPRQQNENQRNKSEIMSFKTSQKLLGSQPSTISQQIGSNGEQMPPRAGTVMEDLPDVIKSFLKEPPEIAQYSKASKLTENEEDSFQLPNNDEEEESKETAEEKAKRELDDRKSREALLTDEQRANILERCEKFKADGNEYFGNGRWKEAEDCYSLAIELSTLLMKSECAIYYSNRAAARIKRELWDAAIEDCNKAEEFGAPNNKPLERRAYARLHSNDEKNLDGAIEDYKKLLSEKPTHKPYLEAKVLLEKKIAERNEKLKNEMFGTLKSLGNMCLKPFGLSTENFELVQNAEGGYSVNMKK